jgi:hypothetical protein
LIQRNLDELQGFGRLSATMAETGGRPGKEYWLPGKFWALKW